MSITPIIRPGMRLYPGMPVGKQANRERGADQGRASYSLSAKHFPGRKHMEPKRLSASASNTSNISAHSAMDVTYTSTDNSGAQNQTGLVVSARRDPLSVSQQYLTQRRIVAHKPMTEEQKRKRTTSAMRANSMGAQSDGELGDKNNNNQQQEPSKDDKKSAKGVRKLLGRFGLSSSEKRTSSTTSKRTSDKDNNNDAD